MTQNQPDPPFTQQQSTFNEKFASDLPQEMNQIPSLEPTITDHESETDISELSFFITSASAIAPRSTCSRDPKLTSASGSQLGFQPVCCAQGSSYKPTSAE